MFLLVIVQGETSNEAMVSSFHAVGQLWRLGSKFFTFIIEVKSCTYKKRVYDFLKRNRASVIAGKTATDTYFRGFLRKLSYKKNCSRDSYKNSSTDAFENFFKKFLQVFIYGFLKKLSRIVLEIILKNYFGKDSSR